MSVSRQDPRRTLGREEDPQTDIERHHECGGGGQKAQGGDPEAGPAAARQLQQGNHNPLVPLI
jgi:hypothetical protein